VTKLLREYVRLLIEGEDQEALLRRWWGKSKDFTEAEEILLRVGLLPIPHSEFGTSYLGAGAFTTAYEALYQGKRVAAKVTKQPHEAKAAQRMIEVRPNLPDRVARHVVHFYDVLWDDVTNNNVIVAEILQPMPESLRKSFWTYANEGKHSNKNVLSLVANPTMFASTVMFRINKMYKNVVHGVGSKKLQQLKQFLASGALDDVLEKFVFSPSIPFQKLVEQVIGTIVSDEKMVKEIAFCIVTVVEDVRLQRRFPLNKYEYDYASDYVPASSKELNELVFAVKHLHRKYNIEWRDLHDDNIMVRPSTGELVISDVGLFRGI
jgi:serine/threonine protein kinase